MHFDYVEEHEMLRDAARGHLQRHDPIRLFREDATLDPVARRAAYRTGAAQGWGGMLVPPAQGGIGASIVEAMVVAEELGYAAHSGAFGVWTAATDAIATHGSDFQRTDILPGLISGERIVAWVAATGGSGPCIQAERVGGGWSLSGRARMVPDADIADYLIVDASTSSGPVQFLLPATLAGLAIRAAATHELSRRLCDLTFSDVRVSDADVLGDSEGPGGSAAIMHQLRVVATLTAADSVGIAARLLGMTVAYTKERRAFGKPVAAFQAVKHRCADMLLQIETARTATWYAAVAMRDKRADFVEAVAIAKFYATEAGSAVASEALQLHGGIGMTWEHDLHIFHKRAKANELMWGANSVHRERVAAELAI